MTSKERNQFLYINSNIDRKPTEHLNSNSFTTVLSNPIQSYSERDYRDWETDRKSTRLNSSH